jgi:hypothetical protein
VGSEGHLALGFIPLDHDSFHHWHLGLCAKIQVHLLGTGAFMFGLVGRVLAVDGPHRLHYRV